MRNAGALETGPEEVRPALLDPLFASLTSLPGVGPKLVKLFARLLERETPRLADLLFRLPTGTIDRRARPKLRDVVPDSVVTVAITVDHHRPPPPRRPRAPYQIYAGDDTVEYAFMGVDPTAADNRWLREAMEQQVPVIYLLGVSPGRYQPIIPTFLVGWHPDRLRVELTFGAIVGASAQAPVPDMPERRYALREIKQRLHQVAFREAVLTAYGGRCAISRIPEPKLLDAAHIVVDADEQLGQPVVTNGLPLSKIHHAAFDAQLIGIDPDYRLHVSDRLLVRNDGPMLEALKRLNGETIHLPSRIKDRPDRERLAMRFERFKATM